MIQISEYVGRGHPDRMADLLADGLAFYLPQKLFKKEKYKSVALEVLITNKNVNIAGEIADWHKLDTWHLGRAKGYIRDYVRKFLSINGYFPPDFRINIDIKPQSHEIANYSKVIGIRAGDQSVSYGFAVKSLLKTDSYMPEDWELAKLIVEGLEKFKWAHNDSKCLVAVERIKGRSKLTVKDIVVSVNHRASVPQDYIKQQVVDLVIKPIFLKYGLDPKEVNIWINPGGNFTVGGLGADTGATNRKLMASAYGSSVAHGGGGCYGKDLTKVDRLGAYWARFICKNMVASGVCDALELGVWFRPGCERPNYFIKNYKVKDFNGVNLTADHLLEIVKRNFGDYYYSLINSFFNDAGCDLALACENGHFGLPEVAAKGLNAEWERLHFADKIFEDAVEYVKGL